MPAQEPGSLLRPRLAVFAAAAAFRILLSALFYGSVDITNDILDAAKIFDGRAEQMLVPYFPGIHLFLRIGGQLIVHTRLPLSLAFKLFPSLFDAGIAALLMDFAGKRSAWLYALAPIPLIITGIHGQWDAVFLFFLLFAVWAARLESRRGDVAAGAAYTLSIVAKPVAAPLLLFMYPLRDRRRMSIVAIAMAATTAAYLLIIAIAGMPLTLARVHWIVKYANAGVQLIGLPELIPIPRGRAAALIALVPLLWLYWRGRISRERAIFFFFLVVVGACGIAAQYLLWVVPFAFAAGETRFAVLYNVLGAIALLCYYQSPGVTGLNVENLGALAPLERLAWLSPAPSHLDLKTRCVLIVADLIIPLLCLAMLATVRRPEKTGDFALAPRATGALTGILMAMVLGATVWSFSIPKPSGDELVRRALHRAVREYALVLYAGPGLVHPDEPALIARSFVRPVPTAPVNVLVIGLIATAIWAAAAAAAEVRRA